ncbi:MAG: CRISPR-associated RAMP protein Csx7 [Nitrososphaerota archaeon]|nr:CRISPR-associated RAMP protein Csx7 [Candidatus Calditenuaceae archaeon]MDW8073149.1 CRISPR-associated RAMP protein Csx7 [Nitrososphaerota archaeon]
MSAGVAHNWVYHSVMIRHVKLEGRIRTLEPLRVGMGRSEQPSAVTDMPVIRIKELSRGLEVPYIPGSSLKGLFRSAAQSLARAAGVRPEPCSGLSKDNCMVLKRVDGEQLGNLVDRLLRMGEFQRAINTFADSACLLCKIFGSPTYKSKVSFIDSYPIDDGGQLVSVPVSVKTGIAIDRSTGAVFGGALYRVEFVEPGALFTLSFTIHNLPNYALGLLSEIVELLNEGLLRVGGFKSRGFGRVKFEKVDIKVRHHLPISGSEEGLNALDSYDVPVMVKRSEVCDGLLVYSGSEAESLLKGLREVWRRYVSSTGKS